MYYIISYEWHETIFKATLARGDITLTYCSTVVAQLCPAYEGDYLKANKQLDRIGYIYNI